MEMITITRDGRSIKKPRFSKETYLAIFAAKKIDRRIVIHMPEN